MKRYSVQRRKVLVSLDGAKFAQGIYSNNLFRVNRVGVEVNTMPLLFLLQVSFDIW